MLRVLLFFNDVYPDGYAETWNEALVKFKDLPFKKILPLDIMSSDKNKLKRYKDYTKFLKWISKKDFFK